MEKSTGSGSSSLGLSLERSEHMQKPSHRCEGEDRVKKRKIDDNEQIPEPVVDKKLIINQEIASIKPITR